MLRKYLRLRSAAMKTLLIDNYDSFTYNLFQLLAEANGEEPIVVRNDERQLGGAARGCEFDNVVDLARARAGPTASEDFGVCAEAIRAGRGAAARRLPRPPGPRLDLRRRRSCTRPRPMHGRLSAVLHDDSPLFAGIPREFQAVRYHSLCVEQPLPDELEADRLDERRRADGASRTARGRCGACSSTPSRSAPSTAAGCSRTSATSRPAHQAAHGGRAAPRDGRARPRRRPAARRRAEPRPSLTLEVKRLDTLVDPERAFVAPLRRGRSTPSGSTAARSTSARASRSWARPAARCRPSITYDVADGRRARRARTARSRPREESIFDYLSREMRRLRYVSDDLPFDFNCGFVGYLGYELKADCEGDGAHALVDARRRVRASPTG